MGGRYLGVDGGGTKTAFVLIDDDATVLAEARTGTLYSFGEGAEPARAVLAEGLAAVTAQAGIDAADIDRAFFALPGYGESSADTPLLDRVAGEVLGHDRYACGNDAVAGWAGSLGGEDGIDVVAGTGSIAYGEWRGAAARAGGWSELFGDEGSAHWIAIRALNAFSRMSDGRLPEGALHAAIREAIGARVDLDVIGTVVGAWRRDRIAALAPVVTRAAADGDAAAAEIVTDAGRELAALVHALRDRLRAAVDDVVPVSYSGGVFADDGVRGAFSAALGPGFRMQAPQHGPELGAALLARRGR